MAVNWRLRFAGAVFAFAIWAGLAEAGPENLLKLENSFSIAHGWNNIGNIDLIVIRSLSDPQFENGWAWQGGDDPNFSLRTGWNDQGNNSLRVMSGPSIDSSVGAAWGGARWSGDVRSVSYDILFFAENQENAIIAQQIDFTYNGPGDYFWTHNNPVWNPTRDQVLQFIPLPPAFLLGLLGLGGVGAGGFLRRRKMAA